MSDRIIDATGDMITMVDTFYPGLNVLQLGVLTLLLGALRATYGHDNAGFTLRDYSHGIMVPSTSAEVKLCLEFLEREIFAFTKSRIDIDVYHTGKNARIKPKEKYEKKEEVI
jgi:hypothetical protein